MDGLHWERINYNALSNMRGHGLQSFLLWRDKMAKKGYDPSVQNRIKVGSPRRSKKKKGNAPSRTARCGSGKKLR